ncbi:hypothetical protein ASG99_15390 [Bacillus sp. Soil768D1]|nr:hypothetical protein ASG99_15390 [Bacillus sp. Soil768D1]
MYGKFQKIGIPFVLVIDQDYFFYKKIMVASYFLITLTLIRIKDRCKADRINKGGDVCWQKKTF